MRFLLDTHIWLWSEFEPWRLTSDVTKRISDPHHELFLSPVSVWEALLLLQKKRVQIDEDFGTWFARSAKELRLFEAPLSWDVAAQFGSINPRHRDPADRLLLATARVYDLTFVTADDRLLNVSNINVLPNR
jgi:PIN domain nuclease of toxin-antitoxin system